MNFFRFLMRFYPAALLGALLVLPGCEGGGEGAPTEPPPVPLSFRVPGDTVRAGSMAAVVVSGTVPRQASGSVGGVPLSFGRWDDSTLVGLVPEVPAGSHPLRLEIEGRTGMVTVSVRPGVVIANPSATVNRELEAAVATFAVPAPDGFAAADWARNRTMVDSLVRDIRTKMASATPAEQLAVARLLASASASTSSSTSNPSWLLMPNAQQAAGAFPQECTSAVAGATFSVGVVIAALGTMFSAFVPGVNIVVAPVGVLLFLKGMPHAIHDVGVLPERCYNREGISTPAALNTVTLERGKAYAVEMFESVRKMNGSDARTGVIAGASDAVERLHGAAKRLPSEATRFVGQLPMRLVEIPASPPVTRPLSPSSVRVSEVQPSTVTVTATASEDHVLLTASSSNQTADIPFTVTLSASDNPALSTRVSAVLRAAPPVSIEVSPEKATIVGLQKQLKLTARVTGTTETAVRWTSSEPRVADVQTDGTVLSRDVGTVTIRATSVADPTKSATASITVTSGIGITLSPTSTSIVLGQTQRLTATLTGTHSEGVVWSSSNDDVATVDAAGVVTAKALGEATIRATAAYDLTVSATASVKVVAPPVGSVRLVPVQTTVTGVQSLNDGAAILRCEFRWQSSNTGSGGTWIDRTWTMSTADGRTTTNTSALTTSGGGAVTFSPGGTHTFWSSWYTQRGYISEPNYVPFSVTITQSYTEQTTGERRTTAPITFNCEKGGSQSNKFAGSWKRYGHPSYVELQVGGISGEPANRIYMCVVSSSQLYKGTVQSDGATIKWDAAHRVPDYVMRENGTNRMQFYVPVLDAMGGTYERGRWTPGSCGLTF